VILLARAPLEEDAIVLVKEHDGHRAMQTALAVNVDLWRNADDVIMFVDEDDEVVARVGGINHDATRTPDARFDDRRAPAASAILLTVVVIARREKLS
jgi:hypothetical protein